MSYDYRVDYPLARCPASWDFLNWLINVELSRREHRGGELKIRFVPGPNEGFRRDTAQQPLSSRQAIFQHVMRPALRLVDAEETDLPPTGPTPFYGTRFAVQCHRAGRVLPKWHVPEDAMAEARDWLGNRCPIVITLRECDYWPERNSNLDAWQSFAAQFPKDEILFIRDTAKAELPLRGFNTCPRASTDFLFRCAIMSLARANLMSSNGPIGFAQWLDVPWLQFVGLDRIADYFPHTRLWWHGSVGIELGGQYPWGDDQHAIVWQPDEEDHICAAWQRLASVREAA